MSRKFFEKLGEYLGENADDLEQAYEFDKKAFATEPLPPPPERRLVKVALDRRWIMRFFSGQVRLNMATLPPDAKAIEAFYEPCRAALMVIVESESFDVVDEGCIIPDLDAEWVPTGNSSS